MKIKIKPNSYYKGYYDAHYSIWCTDNKYAYCIARKFENGPLTLIKYSRWGTIKNFQDFINISAYYNKIEEISKEDLFLELL